MTRAKQHLFLLTTKVMHQQEVVESRFFQRVRELMHPRSQPLDQKDGFTSVSLEPGALVRHKTFGIGRIVSRDKDNITVRFSDQTTKCLSVSVCLEGKLLRSVL